MTTVTTIGYEGASLDDFLATLHAADVSVVLDVRDLPISRRKGFSKSALAGALEEVGIAYIHLRGLGDPKEGQEAARAGDIDAFLRIYSERLATPEAQADLEKATEIVSTDLACLLCYERDPTKCHRKLVSEAISAIMPVRIRHLGVREGLASNGSKRGARKDARPGQGASPCG